MPPTTGSLAKVISYDPAYWGPWRLNSSFLALLAVGWREYPPLTTYRVHEFYGFACVFFLFPFAICLDSLDLNDIPLFCQAFVSICLIRGSIFFSSLSWARPFEGTWTSFWKHPCFLFCLFFLFFFFGCTPAPDLKAQNLTIEIPIILTELSTP